MDDVESYTRKYNGFRDGDTVWKLKVDWREQCGKGFKISDSKLQAIVQAMCCLMTVYRLQSKKSKTRKQEYVFSSAVRLFRYRNISCPSHECVLIRITAKAQSLFSRCSYPQQQDAVSHFIQSLIVCAILDREILWTFIKEVVITDIQGIDPYNNIQIINKS